MLLEIDGLSLHWARGVASDYEGMLGQHDSISDVRNGLDHEVFARLRDPVNYDTSRPIRNVIYHDDVSTPLSRMRMSMPDMRHILVDFFNYMWTKNQVKWPSRTGIIEQR